MMNLKGILFFFSLVLGVQTHAKVLNTEFLTMDLPDNWNCQEVRPNWVCEPKLASERKFAIVTITSKEAGTLDQLSNFEAHLSKARSHQLGSKNPVMSQVIKTEKINLKNVTWVQSIHLNSEVNDFMTMYLATVKQPLAIMVTFSAEKNKWNHFKPLFDQSMNSIQLKDLKSRPSSASDQGISPQAPQGFANPESLPSSNSQAKIPTIYWLGLALAGMTLLAAAYILMKR
jgi:hypothetical protein